MRETINTKLAGLGIALITPFKADDAIDYDALKVLIDRQISAGVDYIVLCGTTAETPTLTPAEKADLVRFAINCIAGRTPVVLGISGNCTRTVIEELRQTDLQGVDAILSVVPYYNKPSQEGIYRHYAALAEASPLPIVLYNVPGRTGVNMEAATTLRLAQNFSNVAAIKEASGNLAQIAELLRQKPEGFAVISGDDSLAVPLMAMGAVGVISVLGNALPIPMEAMVHAAQQGNFVEARKAAQRFAPLIKALFAEGNPAGVKTALSAEGLCQNVLRLPLVPNSESVQTQIKQLIATFA